MTIYVVEVMVLAARFRRIFTGKLIRGALTMWPFTRKRKPSYARPALRGTDIRPFTDPNNSFLFTNPDSWTIGLFGSSGAQNGPTSSHHDCNTSTHGVHSTDTGSCGLSHDGGGSGGGFAGGGHSH